MHGAGNDFVVLDLREQEFEVDADVARRLAHRRTGIGCDQLLVLHQPQAPGCVVSLQVWNADGSRAEQCGNGVRCIGLYLHQRGETIDNRARIEGPVAFMDVAVGADGLVTAGMGQPEFDPAKVPVNAAKSDGWYTLETGGQQLRLAAVSIGNPHAVVPVEAHDGEAFSRLGPAISTHPAFPEGCNAGFVRLVDRNTVELRVWERGSGPTLACGSGACAAAAVLIANKMADSPVEVRQNGGILVIEWTDKDAELTQKGPAVHLYEGTLL